LVATFKQNLREHGKLHERQPEIEGGRQDKSTGMKVGRNRHNARPSNATVGGTVR
jgi:hypothetical protein